MNRVAGVLLAVAAVTVLFGDPVYALFAAMVAVAVAWILDPSAVRAGFRFGVVLGIAFAAAITGAVVTWTEGSQRGLELGGMVLLRLAVLVIVGTVLVRRIDAEALLRTTRRLGFERLGLILGLALNALPRIVESSGDVWAANTMRSRNALDRVRRLPGLGEVLLAHTARIAEEAAAAASLRGHSALTRAGGVLDVPVRTVVLTGPPNRGKTRAIIELVEHLLRQSVSVAGFAQPGIFEDDRKVGFKIRDLSTGEERVLARLGERADGYYGTRFQFSDEGFALGHDALRSVVPGSVLVLDEIGPVELRGEGHMPAVRTALASTELLGAVIVVRRSLVPTLLADLEASDAVVIDIEDHDEDVVNLMVEALRLPSGSAE